MVTRTPARLLSTTCYNVPLHRLCMPHDARTTPLAGRTLCNCAQLRSSGSPLNSTPIAADSRCTGPCLPHNASDHAARWKGLLTAAHDSAARAGLHTQSQPQQTALTHRALSAMRCADHAAGKPARTRKRHRGVHRRFHRRLHVFLVIPASLLSSVSWRANTIAPNGSRDNVLA